jgi:hypothetical protein
MQGEGTDNAHREVMEPGLGTVSESVFLPVAFAPPSTRAARTWVGYVA